MHLLQTVLSSTLDSNIPGITDSYDGANPDLGYREFKKAKSINKPQNLRIGGTSSE